MESQYQQLGTHVGCQFIVFGVSDNLVKLIKYNLIKKKNTKWTYVVTNVVQPVSTYLL